MNFSLWVPLGVKQEVVTFHLEFFFMGTVRSEAGSRHLSENKLRVSTWREEDPRGRKNVSLSSHAEISVRVVTK